MPQSPRGGRPLPKPPMIASGSSSSRAGPSDMYASSSTSASSTPTPLNGTIPLPGDRPGTAGSNGATRRLPLAPDFVGLPMRPSSSASGDSNRLSNNSSYGYSNGSVAKHPYAPPTPVNGNTLQAPQWTPGSSSTSNLTNGHSSFLARAGSTRPKGALAAAVPGQSFSVNDPPASPSASTSSADFYASSPPSDVLPDYIGTSDSFRQADPALKHFAPSQAALPSRPGPSAGPSYSSADLEPYARHAVDDTHPSSSPSLLSPGEYLLRPATRRHY